MMTASETDFDFLNADVLTVGGLATFAADGSPVHWNVSVPGCWVGPYPLARLGSYVSKFCEHKPGVYRLIGLNEQGKPTTLNRMCKGDTTGTLYIGAEGKTFADRSRLGQLVRSLRPARHRTNQEHQADYRLRTHPELNSRFPSARVALTWCYCDKPADAERALFEVYFDSFGDNPPLNFRR